MKRTRTKTKEELTEDYIGIAFGLAWSFNKTTGIDVEELIGEALLAFSVALSSYRPSISEFSTWTYHSVINRLRYYCKKERQNSRKDWANDFMPSKVKPDTLGATLSFLPEEIIRVINTVIENSLNLSELHYMQKKPLISRIIQKDTGMNSDDANRMVNEAWKIIASI